VPHRARLPGYFRNVAGIGNAALGRLEREQAAEMRRRAHRAGEVAADVECGQPGSDRGSSAAARTAGRVREVPGVVGAAEDRVVGAIVRRERRHVGLAEQDRASGAQFRHRRRVGLRHVVLERRMPAGGAHTRGLERVLDRHRHAVQRAPDLATRQRLIGFSGARSRALRVDGADRVQRRIVLLDTREIELDQLQRRETARADPPGELGGAGERVDALV
jgi:hypothetical protein